MKHIPNLTGDSKKKQIKMQFTYKTLPACKTNPTQSLKVIFSRKNAKTSRTTDTSLLPCDMCGKLLLFENATVRLQRACQ